MIGASGSNPEITNGLETFLHEQIPLTQALGVRVIRVDEIQVELRCPLEPNHNHLGSAFGGSLAAVAILAGYAWIFQALRVRGHDVHIILKSCTIEYLTPVTEDLQAICHAPATSEFDRFLRTFEKKGLARIHLNAKIQVTSGTACSLVGEFVAQRAEQTR